MDVQRQTERVVIPIAIIAMLSLIVLSLTLAYKLLPSRSSPTTLGDFPAPAILNRVPGVEGAAAHQGEVLSLRGERCFNRRTETLVSVYWTQVGSTSGGVQGDQNIKGPAAEGCMTYSLSLQMPERVNPGRWVVTGIVRSPVSGEVRYWSTEPLEVVP